MESEKKTSGGDKYSKLAGNTIIFAISSFSSKLLTLLVQPFLTYAMAEIAEKSEYAIGTLYNQSVRALNTMAKGVREAEADPADAMGVLAAVHADMSYVKGSLDGLREDVSALSDRPSLFTW